MLRGSCGTRERDREDFWGLLKINMQSPKTLKSDVVGLLGAATLGVVMLSPAMTLYGGFGPTFLAAGRAAPLAFVWALLATLPTAISYVILSREYPLSGSTASWINLAAPRPLAVWAGWMVFLYYLTNFVIQPVTLGVFAGDIIGLLGVSPGKLTYFIGVVICCALPAWIVYSGVSVSTKGALLFLLFESAVVFALCVTIIWFALRSGSDVLGVEGFSLQTAPGGTSAIFRAMIFAVLAYCGFDVVSTLAEETKMAHRLIPQATILALFLYAGFIIFGIWALSYGGEPSHLKQVAERGQMPISEVAARYWGRGSLWVTLTAISASLGLAIATAVGASRVLYSMGRDGTAPWLFAQLHRKHDVPWNSLHIIFGVGLVASLTSGALVGPYQSYVWWGTTTTFFALATYLLVHLANLTLNGRKAFNSPYALIGFLLVPVIGIGVDGYLLVRAFFIELWSQGWATGRSVILFDVGCALIAALVGAWTWWRGSTPIVSSVESSSFSG